MNLLDPFLNQISQNPCLAEISQTLHQFKNHLIFNQPHGNWGKWINILEKMPKITPSSINLDRDVITIGEPNNISPEDSAQLKPLVESIFPWRKGPYQLFDIYIDAEWRSDHKWSRIQNHLPNLKNKTILDIGCGNGYHCWRLEGSGVKHVLGIDHTMVYFFQFLIFQSYIQSSTTAIFPFSLEALKGLTAWNDIIFSMGVLYHQKQPINHLKQIYQLLKPEGHLVLETLYIEDKDGDLLIPQDRYARMRNVHNLPSCPTLEQWLKQAQFRNIQRIDTNKTDSQEQRSTSWMTGPSIKDFLDTHNTNLTIEGYPAPRRVTYLVQK